MAHWYCENCGEIREPIEVTYDERCDVCRDSVVWVDVKKSFLFNEAQGDYYERTGEKPLTDVEIEGKHTIIATRKYILFLEAHYSKEK